MARNQTKEKRQVVYQALYTSNCPNGESAQDYLKKPKSTHYVDFVPKAFLVKFGGEPFSKEDACSVIESLPGLGNLKPGDTSEMVLESLVKFETIHKID